MRPWDQPAAASAIRSAHLSSMEQKLRSCSRMLQLLLLSCVLASAPLCARAAPSDASQIGVLERFILDNGGKLRTYVGTNKAGVRGLFAKEDIKNGEPLATIPSACIMNLGSVAGSFLTPMLSLMRELRHPASRFAPYLNTLPKRGDVHNACTIDKSLWHLFESDYWVKFADSWQTFLERALNGTANGEMEVTIPEALGNVRGTLTLDELKHACALAATRYVSSGQRNRLFMVPIFDLANHERDCKTVLNGDDAEGSMTLVAGQDYKKGDEICYSYGNNHFYADYSTTHYGWVMKEDPPRLLVIDHHQFNPQQTHQHFTEDFFVPSSAEALKAEVERLKGVQAHLQQLDKEAARTKSRPKKGSDPVADMLVELQAYRRQAVDYEIKRLQKLKV